MTWLDTPPARVVAAGETTALPASRPAGAPAGAPATPEAEASAFDAWMSAGR